jgi:hypothetical protein
VFSETHLKPHERFFIPNYHFYRTDHFPGTKGGTVGSKKRHSPQPCRPASACFNRSHWVFILIGNSEMLIAAIYKSSGHAWIDADITEFLNFRHKLLLAGDLNAEHPFWNSVFSNPSGTKLLDLQHINGFEISASQMSHSLLSYRKWSRARYCCEQKCPSVRNHCL